MSQIDFYHLKDNGLALAVAMLADKTVASGQKFLIHAPALLIDNISEHLWTAKPDNFLAHGVDNGDGALHAPVWITTQPQHNPISASFLCLTDGLAIDNLASFERVFNIFDGSDTAKKDHARQQWKSWSSDSAHQCRYFAQNDDGRWELKG